MAWITVFCIKEGWCLVTALFLATEDTGEDDDMEEQVDQFFADLDLDHDRQKRRLMKQGAQVRWLCVKEKRGKQDTIHALCYRFRDEGVSFLIISTQSWAQPISHWPEVTWQELLSCVWKLLDKVHVTYITPAYISSSKTPVQDAIIYWFTAAY